MGSESQDDWDWARDAGTVLTLRHPSSRLRSTQLLVAYDGTFLLRKPSGGSDAAPEWDAWQRVLVKRDDGLVRAGGALGFEAPLGVGLAAATIPSGYALAVAGSALAEEVVVQPQAEWPDYVFDEGYALMPLAELGAYVAERGHLPGVPTAGEVAAEGVRLGKMQAALLEKVEELTLYVLEQERRLTEMEQELEALRARE